MPLKAEGFASDDLRTDHFLGGRLRIDQPRRGYRAGVDPVFLAAAVPAVAGEAVLELGCGAGVAAICLAARVPGILISGVDVQAPYAHLARANAVANAIAMDVFTADVAALPAALRAVSFDHVIANPPYYRPGTRPHATDPGREVGLGETTPLPTWIDTGLRRLRPGGRITMIQRPDRLGDLLAALEGRSGSIEIRPLAPRDGRDASLILVSAIKGARAPLRLAAPEVLHEGATHTSDSESYRPAARAVLRDGAPWPWIGP
ncbi:MAG: methyltransferase [Pseudomonadota bacterium]